MQFKCLKGWEMEISERFPIEFPEKYNAKVGQPQKREFSESVADTTAASVRM
jgi:hypothetical protein